MEMKKLDKSVLKLYRRQGTVLCLAQKNPLARKSSHCLISLK